MAAAKIVIIFLCLFSLAMCHNIAKTSASTAGGIFISELMWNGSSSSSVDEWVELYNTTDETVDLTEYSLFDKQKNQTMLIIPSGQIASGGYFLISNNSKDHLFTAGESILNIDPDIIDSSMSLNNTNFAIELVDDAGATIDRAGNGAKPFFYEFKRSSIFRNNYTVSGDKAEAWSVYQNDPDGVCMDWKNLDEGARECATPTTSGRPILKSLEILKNTFILGEPIIFDVKFDVSDVDGDLAGYKIRDLGSGKTTIFEIDSSHVVLEPASLCPKLEIEFFDDKGLFVKDEVDIKCYGRPGRVWISEVLPHPYNQDINLDGVANSDDEYIEIVNADNRTVNLGGWFVQDSSGKKYYFPDTNLESFQYHLIFKSISKISINDGGETLALFCATGEKIDEVIIPNSTSKENISYSKWANKWFWSNARSPGVENVISEIGVLKEPNTQELEKTMSKEAEITGEVVQVERSGFKVNYKGVDIAVVALEENVVRPNQKVTVKGPLSGGRLPTIFARAIAISPVSTSRGSSSASNQSSDTDKTASGVYEETTIKKKVKISKRSKLISQAILGVGTGNESGDSLNITRLMIYLSGLFSFLMVVLIYEFCCRE